MSLQSAMKVWDANVPHEREAWLDLWNDWPAKEVSAHPGYGENFVAPGDSVMCASYISADGGAVLFPFILRCIPSSLSFTVSQVPLKDIVNPYGYGGPYAWGLSNSSAVAHDFWESFDTWAMENQVVSEFIRFGVFADSYLPYPGEVMLRSQNIVRSLELDDDEMFMNFEQKVRKNVKKAKRSGLTVQVDETGEFITDFMRLYEGTMDRREAGAGYYFPRAFFDFFHRELPGQFAYFHVYEAERIVSTELVLVSEESVYSFLGGTDSEAFHLRPNDLLKHEVIRWARSRGKKNFVLGGGVTPGDGIERYKRAFAPNGVVDFVTGQRILRPEQYQELVDVRRAELIEENSSWPEDSLFFPAYRMA